MQPPSKKEELELPRLLAALRKSAGMTQAKLGKQIGVHGDTLARYERGVRRVAPDLLDPLIAALKLDDEQAALLRAAREYDEPYWARGMRTALARVSPGSLSDRGEGMAANDSSGSDPTATLSADPTPADPNTPPAFPTAPAPPALPGAEVLEELITLAGDDPDYDEEVRERVADADLLALGKVDTAHLARLLHCRVPAGSAVIPMLPVFTSLDHLVAAFEINPQWREHQPIVVKGSELLGGLGSDEYLGINPWSGREFKLPSPPRSRRRWPFFRRKPPAPIPFKETDRGGLS